MSGMIEVSTPATAVEVLEPGQQELIDAVVSSHRNETGALIPVLQEVQQQLGFLSQPVLHYIAARLDIPFSEVTGVVTFYSYFNTEPRGKHTVRVCLGTACYVRNGKQVLSDLKRELGIDVGQTSDDRQFSLEVGRCFGACGLAPVIMIDEDVHQRVKPARLRELIAPYREEHNEEEAQ